jgi:hypothetical protein
MPGIGGAIKSLIFAYCFPVPPLNFPVRVFREFAFKRLKSLRHFPDNWRYQAKFPEFPCYFPDKQGNPGEHGSTYTATPATQSAPCGAFSGGQGLSRHFKDMDGAKPRERQ